MCLHSVARLLISRFTKNALYLPYMEQGETHWVAHDDVDIS